MATIASRRNASSFTVTRVLVGNTVTGETFLVPGMRLNAVEIQQMIDGRDVSLTADIRCGECGESVADCPKIRPLLDSVPADWSWTSKVDPDFA